MHKYSIKEKSRDNAHYKMVSGVSGYLQLSKTLLYSVVDGFFIKKTELTITNSSIFKIIEFKTILR